MAEAPISLNIAYFPDPVKGQPLALADVYIGQPDLDPEVLANRVEVIVVQESGTRVTIAPNEQPLQTGPGGSIVYQGDSPVVRADGTVSIKVLRNGGGQAYYVPRANEILDTAITNEGVLVLNGSFEVETIPTIPDNWTLSPGTNGTVEVDTTTASHGIKSLKFVGTDVTGGGTATSNRFNVEDSGDLDIGFTYKSTAATSLNKVEVKYYDIGGAPVATISAYSEGVVNPVNFTSFVKKVTGPAGGVTAEVILTGVDGTGTIVNATTRFDDILIVPIPVETNLNDVNVSNDLTVGNDATVSGNIDITGDLTAGKVKGDIYDVNGVLIMQRVAATTPVNYIKNTNSATGDPIKSEAAGTDTDIHYDVDGKGAGRLRTKLTPVYGFVLLDTPELLLNNTTPATTPTAVNSTTLNTAGATKAILKLHVQTDIGGGLSSYFASSTFTPGHEYAQCIIGANLVIYPTFEVNLDGNNDFWYSNVYGIPLKAYTIYLIGYYV